jgi:hypothetical protein
MILVRMNHRELTTESKRTRLSIIRFCFEVSMCADTQIPRNPYLTTFFEQNLVVFAESYAEDDRRHVLEAMNPFFPFASLTANIKHAAKPVSTNSIDTDTRCLLYAQLSHAESGLVDTGGFGSCS